MTSELPAPLVPLEVDLRGYDFMPLYGDRLFASTTWISASAEAKVAALRLWWHAYAKEVPAASLPDDDVLLADYAGKGDALKVWRKLRPAAMRGWLKCSDGRLYHRELAKWALEAWDKRAEHQAGKQRLERHRAERKELFELLRSRDLHPAFDTPIGTLREMAEKRSDAGSHERSGNVSGNALATARQDREVKRSDSDIQNRDSGVNPPSVAGAALADSPKVNGALSKNARAKAKTEGAGQDWDDPGYVEASAKTVGRTRRTGESFEDFRDGVFAAVQQRRMEARR